MCGITCGEWAQEYLRYSSERHVEITYNGKKLAFRELFKSIAPEEPVSGITPMLAAEHLGRQARSRSGYSANTDRKNLRVAWVWGVNMLSMPESNPFARVPKFGEIRKPRYIPPAGDVHKVLAVAASDAETHAFLLTALHAAARRGEIVRLLWEDIDFARRTIVLRTRKRRGGTMESDILPMTAALCDGYMVLRQARRGAHGPIYGPEWQRNGRKTQIMWTLCATAGVPRFGVHSLRHLAASMMDEAGLPLSTIQAVLRYRSSTTTAIYLHNLRGVQVDLDRVFSSI